MSSRTDTAWPASLCILAHSRINLPSVSQRNLEAVSHVGYRAVRRVCAEEASKLSAMKIPSKAIEAAGPNESQSKESAGSGVGENVSRNVDKRLLFSKLVALVVCGGW